MFRVCYVKATNQIIEMQEGGNTQEHLQTLINNAVNAGYNANDIACEFMDEEEYEQAKLNDTAYQAILAERENTLAAKAQAFADNLPAWSDVNTFLNNLETDIEAVTNAPLKSILNRLFILAKRDTTVLYWAVKGKLQ